MSVSALVPPRVAGRVPRAIRFSSAGLCAVSWFSRKVPSGVQLVAWQYSWQEPILKLKSLGPLLEAQIGGGNYHHVCQQGRGSSVPAGFWDLQTRCHKCSQPEKTTLVCTSQFSSKASMATNEPDIATLCPQGTGRWHFVSKSFCIPRPHGVYMAFIG